MVCNSKDAFLFLKKNSFFCVKTEHHGTYAKLAFQEFFKYTHKGLIFLSDEQTKTLIVFNENEWERVNDSHF